MVMKGFVQLRDAAAGSWQFDFLLPSRPLPCLRENLVLSEMVNIDGDWLRVRCRVER